MNCAKCGGKAKVVYSTTWKQKVLRKRKCAVCGDVFYTSEAADSDAKVFLNYSRSENKKSKID